MLFTRHSLHPPVLRTPEHRLAVKEALSRAAIARGVPMARPPGQAPAPAVELPLTTVSLNSAFDSYINVRPKGAAATDQMIVDSGSSVLILPRFEDLAALPNFANDFAVLGASNEPWGCPANVVRGPIELPTVEGSIYTLNNCIFYACTDGAERGGDRTASFGAACLSPWTASGWNNLTDLGVVLQAPLSYGSTTYPFAEFDFAPAGAVLTAGPEPQMETNSILRLHQALPQGYALFGISRGEMWMALVPVSLAIGSTATGWPGAAQSPLAIIDTGGTAAFLSDPDGYVYNKPWPNIVSNPAWTASSTSCESTGSAVTITVGSGGKTYSYTIDTAKLPAPVQGLTLVMCQKNSYMMGRQGLNTGGVSALFNSILVDYAGSRVGFKPSG